MKRRDFVQVCAASAAGVALPDSQAASNLQARMYRKAKLVGEGNQPIRAGSLKTGATYVFDYPFASTPCFLLRLDKPTNANITLRTETGFDYVWEGGVGPQRNIVAYSAICAHKMTYPTKQVSFIGYRNEPSPVAGPGKVITCCSDRSVYDPASGARVVSGPAPQPLATIILQHDPKADELFALGTFGGEKFAEFFSKFQFRLNLEQGPQWRTQVQGTATVKPLENYSTQWAKC
jgi:Rieske Fe-S protein